MSIVASVKVFDGIVLGAESMTQLHSEIDGKMQFVKSYENARKLFRIGQLPVGIMTYGGGNIGNRSMESFVDEFSQITAKEFTGPKPKLDIGDISKRFFEFISEPYNAAYGESPVESRPVTGFFLAGFTYGQHLGSEFEFKLPESEAPSRVKPDDQLGAAWRGIATPFTRLFFGVDPRIESILAELGLPEDKLPKLRELVNEKLVTKMVFDGMPLMDAVKFCKFILETTIGSSTYEMGTPTCGGPIHIAVITRTGFTWVQPPPLIDK